MVAQARVELVSADVNRDNMRSPSRQENVSEAPCRRADIKAAATERIDTEEVESGRELDAAARHPGMGRRGSERGAGSHPARGFDDRHAVGGDEPCGNGRARLGTALEDAGFDQRYIGAPTVRRIGFTRCVRGAVSAVGQPTTLVVRRARGTGRTVSTVMPSTSCTLATIALASRPASAYIFSGLS